MSGSATLLDLIAQSQSSKEITANALFDAGSPATLFGRRASLCSGLNWFYFGGAWRYDATLTILPNNSSPLVLTASSTNYVEADRAGTVTSNTSGFTAGRLPLYAVTTGSASVTSYVDYRAWVMPENLLRKYTVTTTSGSVTLSPAQSACHYVTTSGTLTGNLSVIVPDDWRGTVFCNNGGAFTTTFKTAGGSGIVVAQGKRAVLLADGTNVVRITADV